MITTLAWLMVMGAFVSVCACECASVCKGGCQGSELSVALGTLTIAVLHTHTHTHTRTHADTLIKETDRTVWEVECREKWFFMSAVSALSPFFLSVFSLSLSLFLCLVGSLRHLLVSHINPRQHLCGCRMSHSSG